MKYLLLVLTGWCSLAAAQPPKTTLIQNATLDTVVWYWNGSQLYYSATLTLEAGKHRLILPTASEQAQKQTTSQVHVDAEGVRIASVRDTLYRHGEATWKAASAFTLAQYDSLDQQRDQLARLDDKLQHTRALHQSLLRDSMPKGQKGWRQHRRYLQQIESLQEQQEQALAALRTGPYGRAAMEAREQELRGLQAAIYAQKYVYTDLELAKSQQLTVTWMVTSRHFWNPRYAVHYKSERDSLQLAQYAVFFATARYFSTVKDQPLLIKAEALPYFDATQNLNLSPMYWSTQGKAQLIRPGLYDIALLEQVHHHGHRLQRHPSGEAYTPIELQEMRVIASENLNFAPQTLSALSKPLVESGALPNQERRIAVLGQQMIPVTYKHRIIANMHTALGFSKTHYYNTHTLPPLLQSAHLLAQLPPAMVAWEMRKVEVFHNGQYLGGSYLSKLDTAGLPLGQHHQVQYLQHAPEVLRKMHHVDTTQHYYEHTYDLMLKNTTNDTAAVEIIHVLPFSYKGYDDFRFLLDDFEQQATANQLVVQEVALLPKEERSIRVAFRHYFRGKPIPGQ